MSISDIFRENIIDFFSPWDEKDFAFFPTSGF